MMIDLVGRCPVCSQRAIAEYEMKNVAGEFKFACHRAPVHEECKAQFKELQAIKSGSWSTQHVYQQS